MPFPLWRSPRWWVSKIKRLHRKGPSLAFAKDGFYSSQFRGIELIISLRFYTVSCEALAKPLGNEDRHGPVELRRVVFLTESIVASVL
jgi:hypothetical protein